MEGEGDGRDPGSETPANGDATVALSLDAVLDLLAARERRRVLRILADLPDSSVSLDELVARVVQRGEKCSGDAPSPELVELRLHHVHLPKLEAAGVLASDDGSDEYRYLGDDRLETWLGRVEDASE